MNPGLESLTVSTMSKTRPIYECRCDERLKTKSEKSTRVTYTGLLGELEDLKISLRSRKGFLFSVSFVYYDSRKRELKTRPMYDR
jgi:hypothetical protein